MQRPSYIALAFAACVGFTACERSTSPQPASISVSQAMSAPADERFERALEPREFVFPRDHGPQPSFQTEWWYFTANLRAASGEEFGCQLTFFRRATRFEAPPSPSKWSARDVYMAHFAILDAARGELREFERLERGALELAGATLEPLWRVWNRGWSASGSLERGGAVRLEAREGAVGLVLELESLTEPVLNGERGLSRKSSTDGAASYYYTLPRMDARGTIELDGRTFDVRGRAWFDREWSTSALEPEQVGWDWFALRLGDAGELMLYSMRRRDGQPDAHSSGTWIDARGVGHPLTRAQFQIEALDTWTSPRSAVRYPARWRVRVPEREVELEVTPLAPDQELNVSVRYWEGAVRVQGRVLGQSVDERGYVELAGY